MTGPRPVRVLIVDDEEDFGTAVATRLHHRGYAAVAVCAGCEALRLIEETRYDVMVLDLKMPGMDGAEVLREVRRMRPDLPVVMLTGHGSVQAGVEGMRLGAADFLQKPVAIEHLCTVIDAVVGRARRDHEAAPGQGERR